MAKRVTYASGKTTAQLMRLEPEQIRELTVGEMKSVIQKIGRTASRRLETLAKKKIVTPTTIRESRRGGYSTRGVQDKRTLTELYLHVKDVLNAPTTVKEAEKEREEMAEYFRNTTGESPSRRELDRLASIFTDLENSPEWENNRYRYGAKKIVTEGIAGGKTKREIMSTVNNEWERWQGLENRLSERTSGFFEIE